MQEARVAQFNDLKDGEMKEVKVGETEVLLARVKDEYFALASKCTHYGAPLADGAIDKENCKVVCPWHHACFDLRTGKHLEAPGLDGLPRFGVRVEGDEVFVTVPDDSSDRITNPMTTYHPNHAESYVIVGGGAAAAYAAEGMREAGFTGRIEVITKEHELPYDRPNCSKEYLSGDAPEEWMPLRDRKFYEDHNILFHLDATVAKLDAGEQEIHLEDGEIIYYDKALICTGGIPRKLNIPGADAENLHYLRSLADSRQIRDAGKEAKKAVVIGASFIGMEGAMSLQKLDVEVQVVAPEEVPFAKAFGKEVGQRIQQAHEEAGVRFHLGTQTEKFTTKDGKITEVQLSNGSTIKADIVLVGIGVEPATDFVEGLDKEKDGSIRADHYLHAGSSVYVAGDVASYPHHGEHTRIEHWKVACQQGRIAAFNMAGKPTPYEMAPFFWTAQQDMRLQYLGHASDFDEVKIDGSLKDKEFIAYYRKDGKDLAALACGRGKEMVEMNASGKFL